MGRAVRWPMASPPLPPLLLLLVAVAGTVARPQAPPIVAAHESEPQGFYAPDAWRPVTAGAADTGAGAARSAATLPVAQVYPSDSYGLRIDQDRSRVRVEDMNRSGREDTNSDHSPTAATSSTASSASTATTTARAALDDVKATTATPVSSGAPKANAGVPTPSPLGASIHRVTSQLLTAADDVRTPPKLRHQQESRDGQGMAVPVILEEDELEHPEEILTRRSPLHPGASLSSSNPLEEGISTWVLLSGSHNAPSSTQPSPSPSSKPPPATPTTTKSPAPPKTTPAPAKTTKAPQKNAATTTTTKPRPPTKPTPTPGKSRPPSTTRKPQTTTTAKTTTTTVAPTTTTTSRPKPLRNKTTEVPALAPALTRKPPTTVQKNPPSTTTTNKPVDSDPIQEEFTTVLPIVTEIPEEGNPTTEDPENKTETSTRRTRRPGPGGKKKKNKNKRRKNRPGNNSTAIAESKIGEAETNSTTTKPQNKERPLSTRIYNYLAREVMPSFGVGLLGLAITAGLAGLIMYPFGGGAVRRTYEVDAPNLPQHGNFYYYGGEYDGEDHGQAEESVIRKVFEGMNTESEASEDSRYASQRYPAEGDAAIASGTVTTYAGDVQANRYPTHRYDTSQPGYSANTGAQNSYNTGTAQSSYNTRQDASAYYNVDQSSSYYSPSSSSASTGANSSESGSSGGRVRYREVATGTVIDPQSPNPQQITKKSDYYAYNTGRVRYRDVGTGEVLDDTPRVRFREVGSDTVHYSMNEPTSNDGGVEHGPRHVRVKRQLWDMKEMAKTMEKEDKLIEEQARKMMDESKQMQKELDVMHAKKNKPKKATEPGNKTKAKQDGSSNAEYPLNEIFGMNGDMGDETATSDVMDAEFVTGVPETTEVEIIAVSDDMPTVLGTDLPQNDGDKPPSSQSETLSSGVQDEKLESIMEESNANVEETTNTEQGIETTDNPSDTETPRSDEATTQAATPKPNPDCSGTPTSTQKVPTQSSNPQINLIELIKKIAQLKVQLGISLLKTTSQAFTNYLENVQKRMENVIREAREASYRRTSFWNYRRFKREAQKKQTKKIKRKQG